MQILGIAQKWQILAEYWQQASNLRVLAIYSVTVLR
jgi:hypothetical protein